MTNRITQEANQIRQTHDAEALRSYLHEAFEPACMVPASKIIKVENYLRDFPVDLDSRIEALQVRLANTEASLQKDIQRYELIRENGLSALTAQEIVINGSGDPRMAVYGPMILLHSHLAAYKVLVPGYRAELDDLMSQRIKAGFQLAMF